MDCWRIQDAKKRFSEVISKALRSGPQIVTRRGIETVVVISAEEYRQLTQPKEDIVDFFSKSPLRDSGIVIERDKSPLRDLDL